MSTWEMVKTVLELFNISLKILGGCEERTRARPIGYDFD